MQKLILKALTSSLIIYSSFFYFFIFLKFSYYVAWAEPFKFNSIALVDSAIAILKKAIESCIFYIDKDGGINNFNYFIACKKSNHKYYYRFYKLNDLLL